MATEALSPIRPEDLDEFRQARLLILAEVVQHTGAPPLDLERIGYCDFFSANPFLVSDLSARERARIAVAGFESANLSYQSSSQRFANNRARLQFDLAVLLGRDLITVHTEGGRVRYGITVAGLSTASAMRSFYAESYRSAAAIVVGKLRRLSDAALREAAKLWLRADALMIDLYDAEAGVP